MKKSRLEAFSDGVLAIIITIMVLELKVPHGDSWEALADLAPVFLSYVLSFIYVGIYWNNHHHMFQTVEAVDGATLWANLHLLFWLSLLPFVTGWVGETLKIYIALGTSPHFPFIVGQFGEHHLASLPTGLYGFVLLMAAIAYWILQRVLTRHHEANALLAKAVGRDWKGNLSPVLYVVGIALSFYRPWIATLIYAAVALLWLVPDRRIERVMTN